MEKEVQFELEETPPRAFGYTKKQQEGLVGRLRPAYKDNIKLAAKTRIDYAWDATNGGLQLRLRLLSCVTTYLCGGR